MAKYKYIIIEGNIGSGKTTLSTLLAEKLSAKLVLEEFSDNPFLPKFYADQDKYAFPLELSFLAERYHQLKEELRSYDLFKETIVSDYYFSKSLLFAKENLPSDEFDLYNKLYEIIYTTLPKPDLYIFLYSEIEQLLKNIAKRGREYEQNIQPEYLEKIQKVYISYLHQQSDFPILIIDNTKADFKSEPHLLEKINGLLKQDWKNGTQVVDIFEVEAVPF
jgi:deoxyadenosine/deoxycytidine kinase